MDDASNKFAVVAGDGAGEVDQVKRQMAFLDVHPDVSFGWTSTAVNVDWPAPNGLRRHDSFINLEHALDFLEREMGTDAPVAPVVASLPPPSAAPKAVGGNDPDAA